MMKSIVSKEVDCKCENIYIQIVFLFLPRIFLYRERLRKRMAVTSL
jgi:hypothetical protein